MSFLPPIKIRTYIDVAPAAVYACLTSASSWNEWFTDYSTIYPEVGGRFHMVWRDWGPDHIHTEEVAQITVMDPEHCFGFRWFPVPAGTEVRFQLESREDGTVVTLTEEGYAPDEVAQALECAAGWGEALTLMKFFLEHRLTYGVVP